MKLRKIISGGQTGADQAGLAFARDCMLETGGWAPYKWKTERGSQEKLLKTYGLKECYGGYKKRTRLNVKESDATIRFALDFDSVGEKCTKKAIDDYDKLHLDIDLNNLPSPSEVAKWIDENDIEILNIAGNRQSKSTDIINIFESTNWFLLQVFACLLDMDLVKSEYFPEDDLDLFFTGQTGGNA